MTTRVRRGVAGLPEPLPLGETLLWQGAPAWWPLALRAFHVRKVALYFGLLIAWRIAADLSDGLAITEAFIHGAWVLIPAFLGCSLLSLLAWLSCRSTIFTITDRRVAIRHGIALPVTLNLPFTAIECAGLHINDDATGDIALKLTSGKRIAYLQLWPFARPWRLKTPEPMLRAVREPDRIAGILSSALAGSAGQRTHIAAAGRPRKADADASVAARALQVN